MNFYDILSKGVIGLGFLLAWFAYKLLAREQQQRAVRSKIIRAIYCFMCFSVTLCLIGFAAQILAPKQFGQPLSGAVSDSQTNSYFVVACSVSVLADAVKPVDDLKTAGYVASIYQSSNGLLAVTVPTPTLLKAEAIRLELIRKGLTKNPYVSLGSNFRKRLQ